MCTAARFAFIYEAVVLNDEITIRILSFSMVNPFWASGWFWKMHKSWKFIEQGGMLKKNMKMLEKLTLGMEISNVSGYLPDVVTQ